MGGSTGTAEPQKGEKMALGMVQTGYGKTLYLYTAKEKTESEVSYEDWLAELTTELELAWEGGNEDTVTEENEEDGSEEKNPYSERKKEWEELLEESMVVEAMLRQMLENGLGQREEMQQEKRKKNSKEPDNEFDFATISAEEEGRHKGNDVLSEFSGNSQFFQQSAGNGSEFFSPSAAGRSQKEELHIMCLTCETQCDKKKQWKIIE